MSDTKASKDNSILEVRPPEATYEGTITATLTVRTGSGDVVPGVLVRWREKTDSQQIQILNSSSTSDENGRATCSIINGTVPIRANLGGEGTLCADLGDYVHEARVKFRDKNQSS
ncbi:Ig-like domain-containing protein [Pseudomonas donghuensis]|uniref:Ig-like domain-containing protein n=1 Tax=Pseudomonas donghuensis TaxID=1163398 RepID=UPI002E10E9D3|nr:Ig-like domain-containing protein [Pseudomonas donghuensis]